MVMTKGKPCTGRKSCLGITFSNTNNIGTDLVQNPGLRVENLATERQFSVSRGQSRSF